MQTTAVVIEVVVVCVTVEAVVIVVDVTVVAVAVVMIMRLAFKGTSDVPLDGVGVQRPQDAGHLFLRSMKCSLVMFVVKLYSVALQGLAVHIAQGDPVTSLYSGSSSHVNVVEFVSWKSAGVMLLLMVELVSCPAVTSPIVSASNIHTNARKQEISIPANFIGVRQHLLPVMH